MSKAYNNSLASTVCTKELNYVNCVSVTSSVKTCNVGKRSVDTEPAVTEIVMELDFEAPGKLKALTMFSFIPYCLDRCLYTYIPVYYVYQFGYFPAVVLQMMIHLRTSTITTSRANY